MIRKLLPLLALFFVFTAKAHATDISVAASTINNFNPANVGSDRSITVTATNGSATVTSSAAFPPNIVGIGGFQVLLGGTVYTVSTVSSTSSLALTTTFGGSTGSATMTLYKYVLLQIYADRSFRPLGANYIVQPGTPGSSSWYKRVAASIINNGSTNVLYLPALTLDSTTDATTTTNQARYTAAFYRTDGSLIQYYDCFSSFVLPATTPTTWVAICTFNAPGAIVPPNREAYSKAEIDARLPSCSSGQLYYFAANGNVLSCLSVGTNLSITSGTLNASGGGGGSGDDVMRVQNVKEGYGCVGNGVTNDNTCLANAITAANSSTTKKIVYLPEGSYLITTGLTIPTGVTLRGSGPNSIITTASTIDAVTVSGSTVLIENLKINGGRRGIVVNSAITDVLVRNLTFTAITAHTNTIPTAAFYAAGQNSNLWIQDSIFSANGSLSTTDDGADIFIASSTGTSRVHVNRNRISGGSSRFSVVCFDCNDSEFVQNNIDQNNQMPVTSPTDISGYGIVVYSSANTGVIKRNKISGNIITNAAGSGIYLVNAFESTVTGNTLRDTAKQQVDGSLPVGAISLNGGDYSSVVGNVIEKTTTGNGIALTGNYSTTTLNGGINAAVTSMVFASTLLFGSVGDVITFTIDSEQILCTIGSTTAVSSCTRGVLGTTAATHSNGATITSSGPSNITVAGNTVKQVGGNGSINFRNQCNGCVVDGNTITGGTVGVLLTTGITLKDARINNNTISQTTGAGINLETANDTTIGLNRIIQPSSQGVLIQAGNRNVVVGNTATQAGASGLDMRGTRTIVYNNEVFGNVTGISDSGTSNVYDGNKVYSNTTDSSFGGTPTSQELTITTGTTPSVAEAKNFILTYGSTTTITNFTDGTILDPIKIFRAGNGNVTIQGGGAINLHGGYSFAMATGDILVLRYSSGWYEVARQTSTNPIKASRAIVGTDTFGQPLEVVSASGAGGNKLGIISNTTATGYAGWRVYEAAGSKSAGSEYTNASYSGSYLTNGPSGESFNVYTSGNVPIVIGTNNTKRLQISGAGVVNWTFGSDATGDIHYRDSSGNLVRLGIGSASQCLVVTAGIPAWGSCSAGTGITGTIAVNQVAFGTGTDTIGGDGDYTWTNSTNTLAITGHQSILQLTTGTTPFSVQTAVGGTAEMVHFNNSAGVDKLGVTVDANLYWRGQTSSVTVSGASDAKIYYDKNGGSLDGQLVTSRGGGAFQFLISAASDGTTGQCLQTNGSKVFSFGSCGTTTLPVVDTTSIVEGSSDPTKEIRFEVDGLTTATVRVLTPPDANIVIAGSASALTSGRVPYTTTSGLLLDTTNLLWNNAGTTLTIGASGGSTGFIDLQGASNSGAIRMQGGTHPGSGGGVIFPNVGGSQSSGPGVWWCNGAYNGCSGLWTSNGLNFQGNSTTTSALKIRKGTGTSSDGTVIFTLHPDSGYMEYAPYGTSAGNATETRYLELAANGTNYFAIKAADSIGTTYTMTWPTDTPSAGEVLTVTALSGSTISTEWAAGGGGSSPPFADTTAIVKGSADATKLLAFEVDGLTTATTRTLTPQDASYTIAGINLAQTFTAAQTLGSQLLIATSPKIITDLSDTAGNEWIKVVSTGSAVNEFSIANAATGGNPSLQATGGDTNVGLDFLVKGTGVYNFLATASGPTDIRHYEDTDNGTNYISVIAPASMASNRVATLFDATDTIVGKATTDTFTNKTLTSSTNVLGGVTMTLGSDANGDIYTRASGVLSRVGIGSTGDVLTVSGGAPIWAPPAATTWDVIGNPIANQTLSMSSFNTTHNFTTGVLAYAWTGNTSTGPVFSISQSNGTASGDLVKINASSGSSAIKPLRVMARNADALLVDSVGNVVHGSAALSTSATDGFFYLTSSAGVPAGTPATTYTGRVPIEVDTTNSRLYGYFGGAWVNLTGSGGGGSPGGSSGDIQYNNAGSFGGSVIAQSAGRITTTPTLQSSGTAKYFRLITPVDTGQTASTEVIGAQFGGDTSVATVSRQWATGALTTQRENVFVAPTYAFVGASTLTSAATVAITAAPTAGTNATITNPYALWVQAGNSNFDGLVKVKVSTTGSFANAGTTAGSGDKVVLYESGTYRVALGMGAGSPGLYLQSTGNSGTNGIAFITGVTTAKTSAYLNATGALSVNYAASGSGSGINNSATVAFQGLVDDAASSAVSDILILGHQLSGSTASAGLGSGILFQGVSSTTNAQDQARIASLWTTATHASRSSAVTISTVDNAGSLVEHFRIAGTATANGAAATLTGVNGSNDIRGQITESLTLSTSGTTTDTTMDLPANSIILSVTGRVTTTITTATDWKLGDATIADRFSDANSTMTAGTTQVGINQWKADRTTAGQGAFQQSTAKVRVTTTGTPGAGVIRITIHYITLTAPTS